MAVGPFMEQQYSFPFTPCSPPLSLSITQGKDTQTTLQPVPACGVSQACVLEGCVLPGP